MNFPIKEFTLWAEEETRKIDAILQGQADAKKRMEDLLSVLRSKEDWDESVLGVMNSMAEQILEAAGSSDEAITLADEVRGKVALVEKLLADKSFAALQSRSMK